VEAIADRKIHFAPYARQLEAIQEVLRQGRERDMTDFMRRAVDYYLEARGRPSISEQARMMAEDFWAEGGPHHDDASYLQAESMDTDEEW
jgi:hypothetical protein